MEVEGGNAQYSGCEATSGVHGPFARWSSTASIQRRRSSDKPRERIDKAVRRETAAKAQATRGQVDVRVSPSRPNHHRPHHQHIILSDVRCTIRRCSTTATAIGSWQQRQRHEYLDIRLSPATQAPS